jgi:hypothetical protein
MPRRRRRRGLSGLVRRPPERSGFLRGPFPWDNSDWVCPIAALLQIGPIVAARLGDGGLARRRPGDVARGQNGYPARAFGFIGLKLNRGHWHQRDVSDGNIARAALLGLPRICSITSGPGSWHAGCSRSCVEGNARWPMDQWA